MREKCIRTLKDDLLTTDSISPIKTKTNEEEDNSSDFITNKILSIKENNSQRSTASNNETTSGTNDTTLKKSESKSKKILKDNSNEQPFTKACCVKDMNTKNEPVPSTSNCDRIKCETKTTNHQTSKNDLKRSKTEPPVIDELGCSGESSDSSTGFCSSKKRTKICDEDTHVNTKVKRRKKSSRTRSPEPSTSHSRMGSDLVDLDLTSWSDDSLSMSWSPTSNKSQCALSHDETTSGTNGSTLKKSESERITILKDNSNEQPFTKACCVKDMNTKNEPVPSTSNCDRIKCETKTTNWQTSKNGLKTTKYVPQVISEESSDSSTEFCSAKERSKICDAGAHVKTKIKTRKKSTRSPKPSTSHSRMESDLGDLDLISWSDDSLSTGWSPTRNRSQCALNHDVLKNCCSINGLNITDHPLNDSSAGATETDCINLDSGELSYCTFFMPNST